MKALYAGSFDPITNGHIDIIEQALDVFNIVLIGIADNPDKRCLFSPDERLVFVQKFVHTHRECSRMRVVPYKGMTIDFAHENDVDILIRGLRAVSDFEAEFQMALFNRKEIGKSNVEGMNTLFLIPDESRVYLSSSAIKGIAKMGGNIRTFVPRIVREALEKDIQ